MNCVLFGLLTLVHGDSLFNGMKPRMFVGSAGAYELGTMFFSQVPGTLSAVTFFYSATDMAGAAPHSCALFHVNGTLLAQADMNTTTAATPGDNAVDGWQQCEFASPIRLVPKDNYLAMFRTNKFIYTVNYWSSYGVDSGVLVGVHSRVANYAGGGPFTYPTFATTSTYWVDVIFKQDTLSLPTEVGVSTAGATTQTHSPTTILPSETSMSTAVSMVGSSTGAMVLATSSSDALPLVGILVGVALFVQCVILVIAVYLFVKWKQHRLSTPSNTAAEREAPAPAPTASAYADATEVRQSIHGSAATIRTHEYGSFGG